VAWGSRGGETGSGRPNGSENGRSRGASHTGPDPSYFGHARPEVLALVPETARAVLDIGCGSGRLGEALRARQRAEVGGVELNEAAATAARTRLD
jgi:2-polyprenyl-3-methyl-5-hydroxy-6-metoxy-1,4-benzoquinol methylase